MLKKERKKLYVCWLLLFAIGFIIGMILFRLCGTSALQGKSIFEKREWLEFGTYGINSGRFLMYELPRRMKGFFFLILLSTTYFGIAGIKGCVLWEGILSGIALRTGIYKNGIKGIILILAGTFPHYFVFIPAWIMMLCWCHQICSLLYFKDRNIWIPYQNKKRQIIYLLMLLLWIFCVVLIGCFLECYVNPLLMKDLVHLFYS